MNIRIKHGENKSCGIEKKDLIPIIRLNEVCLNEINGKKKYDWWVEMSYTCCKCNERCKGIDLAFIEFETEENEWNFTREEFYYCQCIVDWKLT